MRETNRDELLIHLRDAKEHAANLFVYGGDVESYALIEMTHDETDDIILFRATRADVERLHAALGGWLVLSKVPWVARSVGVPPPREAPKG